LSFVEAEEGFGAEVFGGGEVEDVGEAVAGGGGLFVADSFGEAVDFGSVGGGHFEETAGEVGLDVAEHFFAFEDGKSVGAVFFEEPVLEADGLPEFEDEEAGDGEGLGVVFHPGIGLGGVYLLAVNGAEEGGVREVHER